MNREPRSFCLFVWFLNVLVNYYVIWRTGPKTERLTILCAATLETGLEDHDLYLSWSNYTDTNPYSRERAATVKSNPGPPQQESRACLFGWFLNVLVNYNVISRAGPKTERLTILRAATLATGLRDLDFCLSQSHYTDTDPTSRERAATAGIEPWISSPGVARSTDCKPIQGTLYLSVTISSFKLMLTDIHLSGRDKHQLQ